MGTVTSRLARAHTHTSKPISTVNAGRAPCEAKNKVNPWPVAIHACSNSTALTLQPPRPTAQEADSDPSRMNSLSERCFPFLNSIQ
jgi:hypothetical protein